MTLHDFYDAIDAELQTVILENPQDERLHKGDIEQRKSFAFLIWFLKFYGQRPIYNLNITEGDDDTSCDIIFSTIDIVGKKVFYVVQAKWKTKKNCTGKLDSTAFKSTLDDFKLVYSGQKKFSNKNENFNRKYEALRQHLDENQYVKFIYLTLSQSNPSVSENLELFRNQTADIEIIDIERLRRDFIEVNYKKIQPQNPLEYDYNPENEKIILPIEQLEIEKNFLRVDAPFNAYTFLIRPKTIHDLFEKYKFKLFFHNIRNPLIASEYNQQIEQTMRDEPGFFWYFNNGITAITRDLPRRINPTAQQIEVTSFQIINGAQTAYSVYKAYKDAKNGKREELNKALVQLRLVESTSKEFDLNITRFTNQQNPTEPRDFWANDPVQVRLQNESFTTNYWYSVKRGEFRDVPENVKVVSNQDFIDAYLNFNCDFIKLVGRRKHGIWTSKNNNIKTPHLVNYKGTYENYFNENMKYIDLHISYRIEELLMPKIGTIKLPIQSEFRIFNDIRIVLLELAKQSQMSLNDFILHKFKVDNNPFFFKVLAYVFNEIDECEKKFPEHFPDFESLKFTIEQIEALDWESILK
jgi:hypothetical protein